MLFLANYTKKQRLFPGVLCWLLFINKIDIGKLKYWFYHILNMHYILFTFLRFCRNRILGSQYTERNRYG